MNWNYIKILNDNYAWIILNEKKEAILIDVGDFEPIYKYLQENNITLKYILITHAHSDHTDGALELKEKTGAKIAGNIKYKDRLPKLDIPLDVNEKYNFLNSEIEVIETPGHTADHISFFFTKEKWLFVGDFLFSLGCGRIFDSTPLDMVNSFNKVKKLPEDTLIFPAHEYTRTNLAFAKYVIGELPKLKEKRILETDVTVPSVLEFELQYNPFLRLQDYKLRKHLLDGKVVTDIEFFTYLRNLKNNYTQLIGG